MFDNLLNFFRRIGGESRSGNPDLAANYAFSNTTELIEALSATPTASGMLVTPYTAQQSAAVFACVRLLSETIAALPKHITKTDGDQRLMATEHPLYDLLHRSPNPEMTSYSFFELLMRHLLLRGNFYAQIVTDERTGKIEELWPLHPDYVLVRRDVNTREILYDVMTVAGKVTLSAGKVLHIKSFSENGLVGLSIIQMMRQSIGKAISADEFGARFFKNNAKPGGYWTIPPGQSDEDIKKWKESLLAILGGLYNAHKAAVVEDGYKFNEVSINQRDSQFLETIQAGITDIARGFRIQPHKIGDLTRSTNNNIESQNIDFVNDTLMPWIVRIKQELKRALLPSFELKIYHIEFDLEHLLLGMMKDRYTCYNMAIQGGWMTRNEARRKENMNPLEGLDEPMAPLNMAQIGDKDPAKAKGSDGEDWADGEARDGLPVKPLEHNSGHVKRAKKKDPREVIKRRLKLRASYRSLIHDCATRIMKRECEDVGRIAKRCLGNRTAFDLERDLADYYAKHGEFMRTAMTPVLRTYFQQMADACAAEIGVEDYDIDIDGLVETYLDAFIARHNGSAQGQLNNLARKGGDEDPLEMIEERLEEWMDKSPDKIADNEGVRGEGFLAKALFLACGISTLRWVCGAKACPICLEMEGKTCGIESNFVDRGESVNVEDGDDLTSQTSIAAPPLHGGCSCGVVAD